MESKKYQGSSNEPEKLELKGDDFLEKENYLEAAETFREAVNLSKSEARKRILAKEAKCYLIMEDYDKALELFNESLSIDKEYAFAMNFKAETLNEQGNTLFDEGKFSESVLKYQQAIDTCAESWEDKKKYLSNLGNSYQELKELKKSLMYFDMALNIDMNYEDARNGKADVENALGDIEFNHENYFGAIRYYQEACEFCTETYENKKVYLTNIGDSYHQLKKLDRALEYFDMALKIDMDLEDAKNGKADALDDQGNILFDDENYNEAVIKYHEAIVSCTDSYEYKTGFLTNLGKTYCKLEEYDKAFEHFDMALSIDNNYEDAKNCKAETLNEQGDILFDNQNFKDAIKKYLEASEVCAESSVDKSHYLKNLGESYLNLNEFERANEYFDMAFCIDSDDEDVKNMKAETLNEQGVILYSKDENYLQALQKFQESFEVCSKSNRKRSLYLANVGRCYNMLKEYNKAIEFFDESLKIDTEYQDVKNMKASVLNNQGKILFKNGKYNEAVEKYEEAIEISSDFYEDRIAIFANLGESYYELKEFLKATEFCNRALSYDPSCFSATRIKNFSIHDLQKILCNEEYLENSEICKDPENDKKVYFNNLGLGYILLKDYFKAKECFDSVLKIDENYDLAKNNKGEALNFMGKLFFKQRKFSEANYCFNLAFECTKSSKNKEKYEINLKKCKRIHKNLQKETFNGENIFEYFKESFPESNYEDNVMNMLSRYVTLTEKEYKAFSAYQRGLKYVEESEDFDLGFQIELIENRFYDAWEISENEQNKKKFKREYDELLEVKDTFSELRSLQTDAFEAKKIRDIEKCKLYLQKIKEHDSYFEIHSKYHDMYNNFKVQTNLEIYREKEQFSNNSYSFGSSNILSQDGVIVMDWSDSPQMRIETISNDPIARNEKNVYLECLVNKIASEAKNLPVCNLSDILVEMSRSHYATDINQEEKLMSWIRSSYKSLTKNVYAKIVMQIVACFPKVEIIFNPNEEFLCSKLRLDGLTAPHSQKIIIAVKGFDEKEKDRYFLGLIIHEFCHFAVNKAFRNQNRPFYENDQEQKIVWDKITEECEGNQNECELIKKAFLNYPRDEYTNELVVRCLQFLIQYEGDELNIRQFEEKFQKLDKVYKGDVNNTLELEFDNIKKLFLLNTEMREKMKKYEGLAVNIRPVISIDLISKRRIIQTNKTSYLTYAIYSFFNSKFYFESESEFIFIQASMLNQINIVRTLHQIFENRHKKFVFIEWGPETDSKIDFEIEIQLKDILNSVQKLSTYNTNFPGNVVIVMDESKTFSFPHVETNVITVMSKLELELKVDSS